MTTFCSTTRDDTIFGQAPAPRTISEKAESGEIRVSTTEPLARGPGSCAARRGLACRACTGAERDDDSSGRPAQRPGLRGPDADAERDRAQRRHDRLPPDRA